MRLLIVALLLAISYAQTVRDFSACSCNEGNDCMDLSRMGRILKRPFSAVAKRWGRAGRRADEIIDMKNEMNWNEDALDAMYKIRRFWKRKTPEKFYWTKMRKQYNRALETGCASSMEGLYPVVEKDEN